MTEIDEYANDIWLPFSRNSIESQIDHFIFTCP